MIDISTIKRTDSLQDDVLDLKIRVSYNRRCFRWADDGKCLCISERRNLMAPVLVILPGLFLIGSFWLEANSIVGVVLSVVISVLVASFLRKWFTEVNRMARETKKIYIQDGDLILEEAADSSVDGRKVKIVDFQWIRCDQINNGYRTYALLFSVVDLDGLPVHSHAGDELPVLECRGICGGREKRRILLAFSTHSTAQVIKLNSHLGGLVANRLTKQWTHTLF